MPPIYRLHAARRSATRRQRNEIVALAGESVSGTISARTPTGMIVTPSRPPHASLRGGDLVELDLDGQRRGRCWLEPSTEWPLHAAIYRARGDIEAIVHAHGPRPPAASIEQALRATAMLGAGPAVRIAQHGVIAVGPTLRDAFEVARGFERRHVV
jgi:L-fuculose-phosphate aldolase